MIKGKTPTELQTLEAAREKMQERKASLQEELEQTDRWLDWFDEGIEIAQANGSAPALPAPEKPKPAPTKPPPRKKGGTERPAGATPERDAKAKSREAGEQTRHALIAAIRAEPGLSQAELAEKVGKDQSTVSQALKSLGRQGRGGIRIEKDGNRKRYFPAEADIAPADASGAKTGPEREIVEVLERHPLTAREVSLNVGRPLEQVTSMLEAMRRRGALSRDGQPAVYSLVSGELPEAA